MSSGAKTNCLMAGTKSLLRVPKTEESTGTSLQPMILRFRGVTDERIEAIATSRAWSFVGRNTIPTAQAVEPSVFFTEDGSHIVENNFHGLS